MQNLQFWANVAFPAGVDLVLSYEIPENMLGKMQVGQMVRIPISTRTSWGMVISISSEKPSFDRIKSILEVLPLRIDSSTFKFWQWLGEYYMASWNRVLDVVLPSDWEKFLTKKSVEVLANHQLKQIPDLTAEQSHALDQFRQNCDGKAFLIHGITGSGKTILMTEMARHVLALGKKVLWLVPEIGLTPQMYQKVESYLGQSVDLVHSALPIPKKRGSWQRILRGEANIILGTRSALLAPIDNLGLIILDEEHDSSYKQVDPSPRYNARDAALWRAKTLGISAVLASATPSLEIYQRAKAGQMHLLELNHRATGASLPIVHTVDLKEQRAIQGQLALSIPLREALAQVLARGEQAILLHNRRGYASAYLCGDCGDVRRCFHCDVSLTFHQKTQRLHCHYCDRSYAVARACGKCGATDWQEHGVAIEKVEEELRDFFPQARVLRLDRDTTSRKGSMEEILGAFRSRDADILLGTQMVVKGHDFPNVTLVGVIAADQALQSPDFRSSEMAFQLLTQVAGRAGRSGRPGHVYFQTYDPQSPILEMSQKQDYRAFYEFEIKHRQSLEYPPFRRMLKIELAGKNNGEIWNWIKAFAVLLEPKLSSSDRLLGPSDAPIAKLRGEHRAQILLFGHSPTTLRRAVHESLAQMPPLSRFLRLHFDMDPRGI